MLLQICTQCKLIKTLDQFGTNYGKPRTKCKACVSVSNKRDYANRRRRGQGIPDGVMLDPEDRERLSHHNYSITEGYARRHLPTQPNGKRLLQPLASDVMGINPIDHPGFIVDHRDRNKYNNCRSNLRVVPARQNSHNRSVSSANTSGIPGVSWHRQKLQWEVKAVDEAGKHIYLGAFDNVLEAGRVAHEYRVQNYPGYIGDNLHRKLRRYIEKCKKKN